LPAQTLAHALLPALRTLIGAHSGGVFWVDAQGDMEELYAERLLPPDAMSRYHDKHYAMRAAGFAEAFRQRVRDPAPVTTHSFDPAEQASEYFRDVMQPLDAYHVLYGILRDGSRPYGQLSLYRGKNEKPFTAECAAILEALLRYIGLGLSKRGERIDRPDAWELIDEALGIVNSNCEVISASESFERLLRLAAVPKVSPGSAHEEKVRIRDFLANLCRGVERQNSARVTHDNAVGRFEIVRFPLAGNFGDETTLGILISEYEPRSLALVRATALSELTAQQREVAILLAQGRTNPEIAKTLGLTLNTTSSHVKAVYAKLDVNDRYAVAQRLIELAAQQAARRTAAERKT
jgi:DNA-binding NarL/FixJ family response regulator